MIVVNMPGPHEVTVEERKMPQIQEGCALIRIRGVGICGGDIAAYTGKNQNVTYPHIVGHEAVGEIIKIEENEKGLHEGDRVALEPYFYCGKCPACKRGYQNNCENLNVLGIRMDGAMAEYVVHPVRQLFRVPDGLPWDTATLIEPVSIALHAMRRGHVQAGQYVAVSGAGPIGMLCAICCRASGAVPILLEPMASRQAFARELGFSYVLDPEKEDCIGKIREITSGNMADAVLECSGAQTAINSALGYCVNSGYIVIIGWPKGEITFNMPRIIRKELNVIGSRNSFGIFDRCGELILEHQEEMRRLITLVDGLQGIPTALKDIAQHPENYMKIIATLP